MPPLFIGLDAGGTKTELLAVAGDVTVSRIGAGVNLQRDGVEHSAAVLAGLIGEALTAADDPEPGGICVGVAGAGRETDRAALTERLRSALGTSLGDCPLLVEHDGTVALEGAFGGASGLMAIVGTGSLLLARTEDGDAVRAGGWGAQIGDDSSGVALGRAVFAAVAADFDGGEPTTLRHLLAQHHGIETADDLIAASFAPDWCPQHLAPLAIAAATEHDWVSTRIVKTQTNALAQRAGWLLTRTPSPIAPRVALVGGLTEEAYYRESLAEAFLRHLPRWRIVRPAERPVGGALALARRDYVSDSGG